MRLRILFHDHCFDGAASAATFTRFFRDRIDRNVDVNYVGLSHGTGNVFPNDAFSGDENAVLDFRYSQNPRLTWWFDHHQSAFETTADEAHFRATRAPDDAALGIRPHKFWDPTVKSCTRYLARLATERYGFDASPLAELVHWAEIIDGALFPTPRMAVELSEPALQLMMLLEASKDPTLIPRIIIDLAERTLSEVIAQPYVQTPLGPLYEKHLSVVRAVRERARCEDRVATYDLCDLGIEAANKFIAYDRFPECLYIVAVTCGEKRVKISVGSNPWSQRDRRHNLAAICERYGGGGHPAVGAISFARDRVEDARQTARDIVALLRTPPAI